MLEACDKFALNLMVSDYFKGKFQDTDDVISEVKPLIEEFIMQETPEYLKEAIQYFLRGINKMDNNTVHNIYF